MIGVSTSAPKPIQRYDIDPDPHKIRTISHKNEMRIAVVTVREVKTIVRQTLTLRPSRNVFVPGQDRLSKRIGTPQQLRIEPILGNSLVREQAGYRRQGSLQIALPPGRPITYAYRSGCRDPGECIPAAKSAKFTNGTRRDGLFRKTPAEGSSGEFLNGLEIVVVHVSLS
jgi:hypothetical protein